MGEEGLDGFYTTDVARVVGGFQSKVLNYLEEISLKCLLLLRLRFLRLFLKRLMKAFQRLPPR